MIGIFDSGHGGLTIYKQLVKDLPHIQFVYLGDHANTPYGNRTSQDILELTKQGVKYLFDTGCKLVILGCNTATAIACRTLQDTWLPQNYPHHNILGIVAPTVEAATNTPWHVQTPLPENKDNTDTIAIFATTQTINSNAFIEEIHKRCPHITVVQQACPQLVSAIEKNVPQKNLQKLIQNYVHQMRIKNKGKEATHAILGCTHYQLVADLFKEALGKNVHVLEQAKEVSSQLQIYLKKHPKYLSTTKQIEEKTLIFTTGDAKNTSKTGSDLLGEIVPFKAWK